MIPFFVAFVQRFVKFYVTIVPVIKMKIEIQAIDRSIGIQEKFQLSALCANVLAAKNYSDEDITALLQAPTLSDPFIAQGIKAVADRIYLALQRKEKVMVCGDYDADGICSTAILVDALRKYGIPCGYYIPNRFKDGYGLSASTVQLAKEKGYSLLITVDNGVKAMAALHLAKELDVDVIVTDHHSMDEEIPCISLLHPQHMGEQFETLSGAGVALTLSRALIGEVKEHVVLACVAAIADVMPLKKETRAIVQLGVQYLKQGICQPIQQLANTRYPKWDEMFIAYQIVPKINATGRLADRANVNNIVKYLLMDQLDSVQQISKQIHALNDQRKLMSTEMIDLAKTMVHPEYSFQLLFHDDFHEGMAGLVAGKLAEELHQPVMVAARNQDHFKGSIRSQGLLDLTTFFDDCQPYLASYGGHKAAAGIGFSCDHKQQIQDYVNQKMADVSLQSEITYEVLEAALSDITIAQVESLTQLAPYGCGFDEPLFILSNVPIQSCTPLSDGLHTKWVVNDQCEALFFSSADYYQRLHDKDFVTFIGNLRINSFMGKKKVNIFVTEAY